MPLCTARAREVRPTKALELTPEHVVFFRAAIACGALGNAECWRHGVPLSLAGWAAERTPRAPYVRAAGQQLPSRRGDTCTRRVAAGRWSPTVTIARRHGDGRGACSSAPAKRAIKLRHAGTQNTRTCGLTRCCWRTPRRQPACPVTSPPARQRRIAVFENVVCRLTRHPSAGS